MAASPWVNSLYYLHIAQSHTKFFVKHVRSGPETRQNPLGTATLWHAYNDVAFVILKWRINSEQYGNSAKVAWIYGQKRFM